MNLSAAQLAVLKADILAASDLNILPNTPDGHHEIARLYNLTAIPDHWVWRSRVTKDDLTNLVGPEGTTFSWTGAGFITRSQGERDAWDAIFGLTGTVNPSLANVRTAFADIFSGASAPAPANRAHLLAVARRKATRGEKLFAVGTGSTAVPAMMGTGAEGVVTPANVEIARNLP